MVAQAGLRLCCSQTSEDRFSCIEVHTITLQVFLACLSIACPWALNILTLAAKRSLLSIPAFRGIAPTRKQASASLKASSGSSEAMTSANPTVQNIKDFIPFWFNTASKNDNGHFDTSKWKPLDFNKRVQMTLNCSRDLTDRVKKFNVFFTLSNILSYCREVYKMHNGVGFMENYEICDKINLLADHVFLTNIGHW